MPQPSSMTIASKEAFGSKSKPVPIPAQQRRAGPRYFTGKPVAFSQKDVQHFNLTIPSSFICRASEELPALEEDSNFTTTMFPTPFFIAPFQHFMPPEFSQMSYDAVCPEMYAFYHPGMQLMIPHSVPPAEAVGPQATGSSGSGSNESPVEPSAVPDGELPFDPPLFGPGPPIVTGEKLKGPRGCNLFVFHLPNEITNWDLYLLFRRHGTILSVHIMVNKVTGLSKGFGFVSYAYKHDACAAIEAMDGFRLGKKRLKVQLKRLQDDAMDGGWEDGCNEAAEMIRINYSSRSSSTNNTPQGDLKAVQREKIGEGHNGRQQTAGAAFPVGQR